MKTQVLILLLVSALLVGLSACGSPADTPQVGLPEEPGRPAQDIVSDPSIRPLPEEWMQVPNTVLTWYETSTHDDEFTNTRSIRQAWVMIGSETDYNDFEQFRTAVYSWYAMMVEEHDDFDERSGGNYTWGDYDIFIDVDIDPDGDWQVFFMMTERVPIDPDQPMG